jgi:hypothetical protein
MLEQTKPRRAPAKFPTMQWRLILLTAAIVVLVVCAATLVVRGP